MDGKVQQAIEVLKDSGGIERVLLEFEDPGATASAGELMRIADALQVLGKALGDEAKELVRDKIEGCVGKDARHTSDGVMFTWVGGREYVAVDTKATKAIFPEEDNPDIYTTRTTRPYIKAEIGG